MQLVPQPSCTAARITGKVTGGSLMHHCIVADTERPSWCTAVGVPWRDVVAWLVGTAHCSNVVYYRTMCTIPTRSSHVPCTHPDTFDTPGQCLFILPCRLVALPCDACMVHATPRTYATVAVGEGGRGERTVAEGGGGGLVDDAQYLQARYPCLLYTSPSPRD